jgi:RNA polymerase sigma-70 factor (ECF subfamily)
MVTSAMEHGQYRTVSDLLEAAAAGDQWAFEQFVALYRGRIFRCAYNHLRDYEAAADVTQNVLLTIHRKRAAYDRRLGGSTWLAAVVHNESIDYVRRERRHRHMSLESCDPESGWSISDIVPDGSESLGDALIAKEWAMVLADCIASLPENLCLAVRQRLSGRKFDEIARELNVALGTTHAWFRKGCAAVRHCMKKKGSDIVLDSGAVRVSEAKEDDLYVRQL